MTEIKPQVVVVWRKSTRAQKRYMTVFNNIRADDILMEKRKPLIPNEYILDEVGVGSSFIEEYKHKYKIEIPHFKNSISLKNIDFEYCSKDEFKLKDINLINKFLNPKKS